MTKFRVGDWAQPTESWIKQWGTTAFGIGPWKIVEVVELWGVYLADSPDRPASQWSPTNLELAPNGLDIMLRESFGE